MPGQGVTSMFNFGQSFGVLKGIFSAMQIPMDFVSQIKWKKFFNLINTNKDASRTKAIEIYPYFSSKLSKKIHKETNIPLIGIGAGDAVDGQVLVIHDLLGLTNEFNPRFLRRYLDLNSTIKKAVKKYVSDVKSKKFPNKKEMY